MVFKKIRSYSKINLALNIIGKTDNLHKIESLIAFTSLHDEIFIKKIKSKKHQISFFRKFSKKIGKNNTVTNLLKILEKKKLIFNKKFSIKIHKKIPNRSGLGGGSMNAASILKYFIKNKIIKIKKKEIVEISRLIGSDVILGLNSTNSILTSKNDIRYFKNIKNFNVFIVKANFGFSTKKKYFRFKKFNKSKFKKPNKKMFEINFLKKTENQLESVAFSKYPKLKFIKSELENINNPFL